MSVQSLLKCSQLVILSLVTGFSVVQGAVPLAVEWRSGYADNKAVSIETLDNASVISDAEHRIIQFSDIPSAQTRSSLSASGIELLDYLGDNAYFAVGEVNISVQSKNSGLGIDYSFYSVLPQYKLDPKLISGDIPDYACLTSTKKSYTDDTPVTSEDYDLVLYVLFHKDIELEDEATEAITRHNGEILNYIYSINGMVIKLAKSRLEDLSREDSVQWLELPLPVLSENNDSCRDLTQANMVQSVPYSLDGSGVKVMVYDGSGADNTHNDFGGRLTRRDGASIGDHATHVSGTIGGDGTSSSGLYKGMAPNVTIESYAVSGMGSSPFYTDPGDIERDYLEAINTYGVMIANNSVGSNVAYNGFSCSWEGNYGAVSMLLDSIVTGSLGNHMRIVWANGNERSYGTCGTSYGTVPPPSTAKNHIAVGAIYSNNDAMTNFSSWGPTDDGRIKPDICAPGCQSSGDSGVTSTVPGNTYDSYCGTSMAAPVVTGLCALIIQDWQNIYPGEPLPLNSMLKCLLAHNAVDLGNKGPDYQSGYGSVRVKDTIDFVRGGSYSDVSVVNDDEQLYYVDILPGDKFKFTIAWDDAPATANVVKTLINDIDIVAISPSGVIHYPWTLNPSSPSLAAKQDAADHINNIEQIEIENPEAGTWTVSVIGYSIASDWQVVSMAASPNLDVVVPDDLNIIPAADINFSGEFGELFSGRSAIFRLSNTGNLSFDWAITTNEDWCDISTTSGTLTANGFIDITITLNDNADTKAAGSYAEEITITNTTSGYNAVRLVDLIITAPKGSLSIESQIPSVIELYSNQSTEIAAGLSIANNGAINSELIYQISVSGGTEFDAAIYDMYSTQLRSEYECQDIYAELAGQPDVFNTGEPSVGLYPWEVFVENTAGQVQILAYTRYTDTREGGEYENTLNAIAEYYTNFSVTNTTVDSPELLAGQLAGKDIFLIVEQEKGEPQSIALWAETMSEVLYDFCSSGGIIIISDHNYGDEFINGTGFMSVGQSNNLSASERNCSVVSALHPVNIGLNSSFVLANSNASFIGECDGAILAELDEDGSPVAVDWKIGLGNVVLLGCDFFSYNSDMALIMSNAVRMADKSASWLRVGQPLNGIILGGEIIENTVFADATGYEPGIYNATIIIASDDRTEAVACQLLVKADEIEISPEDVYKATGPSGGPFDVERFEYLVQNVSDTTIEWQATQSQSWLSVNPAGGILNAGEQVVVTATINSRSQSLASDGEYTDTIVFNNITSGTTQNRTVEVSVKIPVLFSEDFESGTLGSFWKVTGTNSYRTQVTTNNSPNTGQYHLTMDSSLTTYSRNELTLAIDLEDCKDVSLSFWAIQFGEEPHSPYSNPFINGADFDGVAISQDGTTWYEVVGLRNLLSTYSKIEVDLDAAILAYNLSYNSSFQIRFNQYDNYMIGTDGIAIDDITITGIRQRKNVPILEKEPEFTNNYCNTISWTMLMGNYQLYQAQCSSDELFNSIVSDTGWISESSAMFCNLMPGSKYWYRVRSGESGDGQWQQDSKEEFTKSTISNLSITDSPGDVTLKKAISSDGFADDFEDGDYDGWEVVSTSYTYAVTDLTAAAGTTRSVTISGGKYGHSDGLSYNLGSMQPEEVSFYVRSSSTSKADAYFVLGNGGTSSTAIFFFMKDDGTMGIYSSTPHNIPYNANQWYKITFNLDWQTKKVDYYVDDKLAYAGVPFRNTSLDYISRVDLYNYDSSQAWWDEIVIGSVGDTPEYNSRGTIVSPVINRPNNGNWDKIDMDFTVPASTDITVDILDATTGEVLLGGVSDDTDISSISNEQLIFSAELTTSDASITPSLHRWGVSFSGFDSSQWSLSEFSTQRKSADITEDGIVDIEDLSGYAGYWLDDCQAEDCWCFGTDSNRDGTVNMADLAFLAVSWLNGSVSETVPLVAHWQFDNPADPGRDSSPGLHHSTPRNGATWISEGRVGGAMLFDGSDDYMEVEGYGGIGGINPRTVMAFIKAAADPNNSEATIHTIVSWGVSEPYANKKLVFFLEESGKLAFAIHGARVVGGPSLEDGLWHHVALVFSGVTGNINETKFYIDGVEVSTNASDLDTIINTTQNENVLIGALDTDPATGIQSPDYFFKGAMDEVRIYDIALNAEEINEVLSKGLNLLAHYEFETENSGVTPDSGNNYLHAELKNGAKLISNGRIGNALELDGIDDYVQTPYIVNPSTGPFSAFAWVKGGDGEVGRSIICQSDGSGTTGRYWLYINSNNYLSTMVGGSILQSSVAWTTEMQQEWHHVGLVWDGTTRHIYLDGNIVISDSQYTPESCDGVLYIGAHKYNNNFWEGLIDDVRVYNKALTIAEVGKLLTDTNLILQYKFETENGGVTADSGISGIGGVLINGASLDIDGQSGSVLTLDGIDDHVSVPANVFDVTEDFSVFVWVNLSEPNGIKSQTIFQQLDGATSIFGRQLLYRTSDDYLASYLGGTARSTSIDTVFNTLNVWQHVGLVYSAGTVSLYNNGQLVGTASGIIPESCDGYFRIGAHKSNPDDLFDTVAETDKERAWDIWAPWHGAMDDLRIYNIALLPEQVQALYAGDL